MRVLLDEWVPRALRKDPPGHEVTTLAEAGWAGLRASFLSFASDDSPSSRRPARYVASNSTSDIFHKASNERLMGHRENFG